MKRKVSRSGESNRGPSTYQPSASTPPTHPPHNFSSSLISGEGFLGCIEYQHNARAQKQNTKINVHRRQKQNQAKVKQAGLRTKTSEQRKACMCLEIKFCALTDSCQGHPSIPNIHLESVAKGVGIGLHIIPHCRIIKVPSLQ